MYLRYFVLGAVLSPSRPPPATAVGMRFLGLACQGVHTLHALIPYKDGALSQATTLKSSKRRRAKPKCTVVAKTHGWPATLELLIGSYACGLASSR